MIHREGAETRQAIDTLSYLLYGLTTAEIKIIEGMRRTTKMGITMVVQLNLDIMRGIIHRD